MSVEFDGGDAERSDPMRCGVSAWVGSANLGDELVYASLATQLRSRGLWPVASSIDPDGTRSAHGTGACSRYALVSGVDDLDGMVLGGGGLLQDETSSLNLDRHLAPVVAARLRRRPVVGVGLGVGALTTRLGRARVRAVLGPVPLTVRDEGSADIAQSLGLRRPVVAADLALRLPAPATPAQDRIVVCLRPWSGGRHVLPASMRRHAVDDVWAAATAAALDELATATGMPIHLVAFDGDKDPATHGAVASHMTSTPTTAEPSCHDVLEEVAASRLVVSMRYHGGIAAVLAGRPMVLVGYSGKVDSLAHDVGRGAAGLRYEAAGISGLVEAAEGVLGRGAEVVEARERLRERERNNGKMLDGLADGITARRTH